MSNSAEKIAYTMMRVSKTYHNKVVLEDISLSCFLSGQERHTRAEWGG